MNIREVFKYDVSKSAFKIVDDVTRIIGKRGEIEIIDNEFDIYFVGPGRTPLHGLTLSTIRKKLLLKAVLTELNGEAYLRTKDYNLAVFCLDLLKVRKRRKVTEESRRQLAEMRKNIRRN